MLQKKSQTKPVLWPGLMVLRLVLSESKEKFWFFKDYSQQSQTGMPSLQGGREGTVWAAGGWCTPLPHLLHLMATVPFSSITQGPRPWGVSRCLPPNTAIWISTGIISLDNSKHYEVKYSCLSDGAQGSDSWPGTTHCSDSCPRSQAMSLPNSQPGC